MARSTFDGPILAGNNRFPPFRNVGFAELSQVGAINFTVGTANTAQYAGGSGQFVTGVGGVTNTPATVYVPSATNPNLGVQTVPADTATQIYRGFVMYVPTGANLNDFFVDVGVVPTVAAGTISTTTVYVSNNYTVQAGTPTYAATGSITAVGRQALSTFTATQLANQQATSTDILQSGAPNLSQVVFTVSIAGTGMTTLTAGTFYFTCRYLQAENAFDVGNTTTYPYGNFD